MDPNFVYKAKVPELKINDIEVHANLAKTNKDPASCKEAIQSEDRDKWTAAIEEELKSMKDNNVWTVIDKPDKNLNGQKLNLIDSKWVFKKKIDENGKEKFKARLVIRGFKDKNSYELKETYAPVSRLSTIRTALAVINKLDLDAVQLDVKTAFLNGNLADEIYMEIPDGLEVSKENNRVKVYKLQRTIYGLKASPKIWNQRFTIEAKKLGLEKDLHEACLFTWRKEGKVALLVLYVDDIILASNCKSRLNEIKDTLCNAFEMKNLGEPSKYLGMEITRNRAEGVMKLTQVEYTNKVLERFRMDESKPQNTPMVTRQVKSREIKAKTMSNEVNEFEYIQLNREKLPFREAIGSLMYLATVTRPDIAYAVNYRSWKQVSLSENDWKDVKRIFRYLQGTKDVGLIFYGRGDSLTSRTDSSFRDHIDSTSTSGYVIKLFDDPVAWRSHKQNLVTLSTCQAEYLAMSETTQELISLDKSTRDMIGRTTLPAKIRCDNRSAIDCTQMDGCHKLKNFDDPLEHIIECLREREKSGVSFRFLENEYFLEFLNKFRPTFKPPKRAELSGSLLEKIYEDVERNVKAKIEAATTLTMQCDSYTNINNEAILIFVVNTPEPVFYKSGETKSEFQTREHLGAVHKLQKHYEHDISIWMRCSRTQPFLPRHFRGGGRGSRGSQHNVRGGPQGGYGGQQGSYGGFQTGYGGQQDDRGNDQRGAQESHHRAYYDSQGSYSSSRNTNQSSFNRHAGFQSGYPENRNQRSNHRNFNDHQGIYQNNQSSQGDHQNYHGHQGNYQSQNNLGNRHSNYGQRGSGRVQGGWNNPRANDQGYQQGNRKY
ncbi:unnamed protein product [Trichogramma brassicae]|uniref:Reverse transcriptase Ty1/copia-type domain-containing protein n=1 Tax=Trichogramma brassicae TaxID=86971 RepID=A0A6H5IJK4_9HYME|nr:unnamed protein product [Trichogramma brassicae]